MNRIFHICQSKLPDIKINCDWISKGLLQYHEITILHMEEKVVICTGQLYMETRNTNILTIMLQITKHKQQSKQMKESMSYN